VQLINNTLLKKLVPIKQLQNEHQSKIAEQSHVIELVVGDELFANEEHRWFVYLVKGKLDLLEENSPTVLLDEQDIRAYHPLFNETEHKTRIIAHRGCVVARFDKQLFHTFIDDELITGEELETVEMSEIEGNLFNEIMHAFNMGDLKLPSLPDIAVKVKKALNNPNANAEDVAFIVTVDPAMVTRLIKAANGPLNRGVEPVDSIQAAIVRLGLKASKELITSFAIKQLFTTKSKMLNQRMHDLYNTSVDIAAISFALSKQSGKLSPDHMLLAGLLHQIGVIPILSYIEDTGLIISDEAELDRIIKQLRGAVGSMVIRHWELSGDLLAVVEEFENWQRQEEGKIDTCDMIIIAQIYHRLKYHQLKGLPKIESVPAFKKLYPGKQEIDFAQNVFQKAQEEIASIMQVLKM